MFGISPLGWVHTLGSLPAIPAALYLFVRYGRIEPRSTAGAIYFVAMLIGALSVILIAHVPISYVIAGATLLLLLIGYGVAWIPGNRPAKVYVETISLTLTAFLLMVPTVSETLRRVPEGHPFVTDPKSPILLGAQGAVLLVTIVGLAVQIIRLRASAALSTTAEAR